MIFSTISARLAQALANGRDDALIAAVSDVLGQPIDREGVAKLGEEGRITTIENPSQVEITYLLDGKPFLFFEKPAIKFDGTQVTATQNFRRIP